MSVSRSGKWLVLIGVFLFLMGLAFPRRPGEPDPGGDGGGSGRGRDDGRIITGPRLDEDSVRALSSGPAGGEITGVVANDTAHARKLRYVQITFLLYDGDGAQVGTALANTTGLEPGGRWRFRAVCTAEYATYKLSGIEYWAGGR